MKIANKRAVILRAVAAAASGTLLASAYPPVGGSEAAWAAFVPLLVLARFTPPKQSFSWGFRSGLVFWLLSLAWLLRLLQTGQIPPVASVTVIVGWVALAAYCALYTGAFTMLVSRLFELSSTENRVRNAGLILVVPLLWVGLEALRSTLCTGFPWNHLGVSQYRNAAVIQIAEWGGVYAVSAVVMVMNVALALTALRIVSVYRENRRRRVHVELMMGLLVCALSWMHGMRAVQRIKQQRASWTTVKVSAIQPNIEQTRKWTPDMGEQTHERLRMLTEMAVRGSRPDLVVWPETAVPGFARSADDSGLLVRELSRGGVPLLVGTMDYELRAGREYWFNSSVLFDSGGVSSQIYSKRHLVPFGEYVPFENIVPVLNRLAPLGFSCTPGTTSTVFRLQVPAATFSALICFEDTVPWLSRRSVRNGAGFLVVQTNDAWFDNTSGPVQHLAQCVFRCIENRVEIVRVANTGVTCFIDSTGVVEYIGKDDPACGVPASKTSAVRVRPEATPLTFYSRYGDWAFAFPCAIGAALSLVTLLVWERRRGSL